LTHLNLQYSTSRYYLIHIKSSLQSATALLQNMTTPTGFRTKLLLNLARIINSAVYNKFGVGYPTQGCHGILLTPLATLLNFVAIALKPLRYMILHGYEFLSLLIR
jgi:hypothetical protein